MSKIVILESIEMSSEQIQRLKQLGDVSFYDSSTDQEAKHRIVGADVVVVDWIDPSPFVLSMKKPSLLALMSTGYEWVGHREEARRQGVLISNIPGYATEAVAEHLLALALAVARKIPLGDRLIRSKTPAAKGSLRGIELRGRQVGVIGLGRIGLRLAEICQYVGMRAVAYNRTPKRIAGMVDVCLKDLLATSDLVAVCCPLNADSRAMLDAGRLASVKPGAILVGATWDVVVLDDVLPLLQSGRLLGMGFDVAIEGGKIAVPNALLAMDNTVFTPHVGFNTVEAKQRQVDICINNICASLEGRPQNIVN